MPNVVRFVLSTARDLNVAGVGDFVDGVLDVDANNLKLVSQTRYLVRPYGATEIGVVDGATPAPDLPAVPGPISPIRQRALAVGAGVLAGALVFTTIPALAAPDPLPAGAPVTAEDYNELVASIETLEAAIEANHPGSFPDPEPNPDPVVETGVEATATASDGEALLTWNATLGDLDPATVDGVYVYRDGVDSNGTGSWGTLETDLDGSRTFLNLVNGTTYTLGAEIIVDGAPVATDEIAVTPTASGTTPVDPPTAGDVQPAGSVPGDWDIAFQDEFSDADLAGDWTVHDGGITMNNVTPQASNVSVVNGELRLNLSSSSSGAMVSTSTVDGRGTPGFELQEGQYVEARVYFPGNGTDVYNWSAFWANADPWACGGEHDIAETLDGGDLTVNYHYGCWPNVTNANQRPNPSGYWGDAFHTYGLHRKANSADVYWDGQLVHSYATNDNGDGESIILNVGSGTPSKIGPDGALRVDYVRAWQPAL